MNKRIYAVKDRLSLSIEQPFTTESDLTCLRMVSSQVNSELSQYEKGAISYNPSLQHSTKELLFLGEIDENGVINPCGEPHCICRIDEAPQLYQKLLSEI